MKVREKHRPGRRRAEPPTNTVGASGNTPAPAHQPCRGAACCALVGRAPPSRSCPQVSTGAGERSPDRPEDAVETRTRHPFRGPPLHRRCERRSQSERGNLGRRSTIALRVSFQVPPRWVHTADGPGLAPPGTCPQLLPPGNEGLHRLCRLMANEVSGVTDTTRGREPSVDSWPAGKESVSAPRRGCRLRC